MYEATICLFQRRCDKELRGSQFCHGPPTQPTVGEFRVRLLWPGLGGSHVGAGKQIAGPGSSRVSGRQIDSFERQQASAERGIIKFNVAFST